MGRRGEEGGREAGREAPVAEHMQQKGGNSLRPCRVGQWVSQAS